MSFSQIASLLLITNECIDVFIPPTHHHDYPLKGPDIMIRWLKFVSPHSSDSFF
jgi:hypothetical protein